MNVTQRGQLSPDDEQRLRDAQTLNRTADEMRTTFRLVCVEMMDKSSIREVARLTGLSTNTLQRWKREATR